MELRVRTSMGKTFTTTVRPSMTVREFKEQIADESGVAADVQRLIYKGRALKDDLPMEDYDLEAAGTVHLVRAVQPVQPAPQPPQPQHPHLDPDTTARLMQSPLVQSMLQNPETVRSVIDSTPRLRAMVEANPQLRHALSDPNVLREAFEVARHLVLDPTYQLI